MEPEKKSNKTLDNYSIYGTGFPTENHLKIHVESVHENQKPHNCWVCDKGFYQKAKLRIHIESVHEK